MNERFLFRGKRCNMHDPHNGEWVYGDLIGSVIVERNPEAFYVHSCGDGRLEIGGAWAVDLATIGQCTGLRDKNGKLIYAGDIFSDGAIVGWLDDLYWDGGGSSHPGFYCEKWLYYGEMSYHKSFDENIEIVGNIHDNPELLAEGMAE